jgi:hypothetical protein
VGEHRVLRFLLTAGLIAALTAALARWLRGPATDAFTEPSVWPPAKPWPRLDEPAADEAQEPDPAVPSPSAEQTGPSVQPEQAERGPDAAPARAKRSAAIGGAGKKALRVQATPPAPPPDGAVWKAGTGKTCPDGYPIKVKVRSGLYHEPGMFAYDRTNPDRCYPSAETAEADGFTRAKR